MNLFEKMLYFLQGEMTEPVAFGWFHLMWLFFAITTIYILYKNKKGFSEKQLKTVLGVYGIVALVLEVGKQLIWSFNYNPLTNIVSWDYQWYAFPFQLCTTPIYVSIFCLFLKKCELRNRLLSYISYITILGSIATVFLPNSCFTSSILVNIHTMWLHIGSLVVSVYLLMSGEVKVEINYLKNSYFIFLFFSGIAFLMNIFVYNIGILNGEEFNMFYISPYFLSELPGFNYLQLKLPYIPYLFSYIFALMIGGLIIYNISKLIKHINKLIKI